VIDLLTDSEIAREVAIGFLVSVAAGCFWGALFYALYRVSNPETPDCRRRAARIFTRIAIATTCFAASVYALALTAGRIE
jgi:hypothetical protein